MKWVKDQTGRFAKRPHYLPEELDIECENVINSFLVQRYGTASYPIKTDDLTVLMESLVDNLDLYADLSEEGGQVEGVTDFFPSRRPKVKIAGNLSTDPRMSNRLRTTLTHELGHVKLHAFMFDVPQASSLIDASTTPSTNRCKRDSMLQAPVRDWMEWQAAYACGAYLMPLTGLRSTVRKFAVDHGVDGAHSLGSTEADGLIEATALQFEASREAARVRLLQLGLLSDGPASGRLF